MRVALDISVLGDGHADTRCRAGIFRATEGVMAALVARDDLDVCLVAGGDLATEARARRYVAASRLTDGAAFVSRWRVPAPLAGVVRADSPWRERARRCPLARTLWAAVKPLVPVPRRAPGSRDADVYHSLWGALPPRAETHARVRFLTIYDLAPLLVPACVQAPVVRLHDAIRASVRLDRDWIVCPSAAVRDELSEHLAVRPERIVVAPLAADARFHPEADAAARARVRVRYGLPDAPFVLSVATLEPRKNLAHLIRCFARVVRETPRSELHLVLAGGEGWQTESVRAALADSGIRERIHLTGYVADEDLSALYGSARAFACVSLYEGFGLPVLEAMQCGTPVIASDRGALREVAGDAGVLIDPMDADALCHALRALDGDEARRRALAARGMARAAQFSWQCAADRLVDAYRRALASA